jgi:hypothetical protein
MSGGEEYTGLVSGMKTSPWLASEDLDGLGDVPATIEAVYKHTKVKMKAGRVVDTLYSIKFAGKEREMVCNATNRKTLAGAYGAKVQNWHGKRVLLYVASGIKNPEGGAPVKGLRIRIPKQQSEPAPEPLMQDEQGER